MEALKLELIKKILRTENLDILQTIDQILSLDEKKVVHPSLNNQTRSVPSTPVEEISDLQSEMDSTFGGR